MNVAVVAVFDCIYLWVLGIGSVYIEYNTH